MVSTRKCFAPTVNATSSNASRPPTFSDWISIGRNVSPAERSLYSAFHISGLTEYAEGCSPTINESGSRLIRSAPNVGRYSGPRAKIDSCRCRISFPARRLICFEIFMVSPSQGCLEIQELDDAYLLAWADGALLKERKFALHVLPTLIPNGVSQVIRCELLERPCSDCSYADFLMQVIDVGIVKHTQSCNLSLLVTLSMISVSGAEAGRSSDMLSLNCVQKNFQR